MRSLLVLLLLSAGCSESSTENDASVDLSGLTDGGADANNGAPSTNYPAPHPPLPQLINRTGGPVLTAPKVYLVFYANNSLESQLQTFAQKLAASSYWATTTSEYGVGALTIGGTIDLTEAPPTTISSDDLQTWVKNALESGKLGTPDPEGIYTIFFPKSTTITQPNPVSNLLPAAQSCQAFDGYHDDTTVPGDGGPGTVYAYAVIPTCGGIDSITATVSHEWVEASTDPRVTSAGPFTLTGGPEAAFYLPDQDHLVWALLGGGEAGDLCEPEGAGAFIAPSDIGHQVQRTWSNTAAAASHDPCVPEITGAFFDAAPVLNETVSFNSTITGMVTSKGVTIPVGSSKTIDVDLFSDGDTGGPFTVRADDLLSTTYGSYGLQPSMTFAWDRTQGVNGEILHLTITVTQQSAFGGAHAFMITATQNGRKSVWPGLVVE
jgi:hypothetical protein